MNSTKSEAKLLKEKLFSTAKHGAKTISEEEMKKIEEFSKEYKVFLNASKTERESVSFALEKAKKAGFTEFDKFKKYNPGDKVYLVNRGHAIALMVMGKQGTKKGVKLAISHVDAPRLDLKPNPLFETNELAMLKSHYYGGIKKYQWTTIPLSLHGRIVKRDGSYVDVNLGEDENDPCFCVTDLLPHLAREQMNKKMSEAIMGEDLNILIGSMPFKDDSESELVKLNILKLLNEKYGIVEDDLISSDLELVPAMKAQDVGFDRSMIGGYAHDDRSCAYPCIEAILNCSLPEKTTIVLLADKEETGSDGNTGMQSNFLKYLISDLANMDNIKSRDVLSKSKCLSADVNAAYDPTFAGNYEIKNSSFMNHGVVVTKYTGSGGKYGTSDASAEFTGEICKLFSDNNVVWQSSELGKVDIGGGGTIAKYIANLNADVIDVGVPVLSMHSPFEVISKIDLYMTFKGIKAFFSDYDI
ncbi:MAG: aminopeptidase [Acutalibacteraceae bacterium]